MTTTVTPRQAIHNSQDIKFHSKKVELTDYTGVVTTFRRINATTVEVNGEAFDTEGRTAIDFVRITARAVAKVSATTQAARIVEFARTAENQALNALIHEVESYMNNVNLSAQELRNNQGSRYFETQVERAEARAQTACQMFVTVLYAMLGTGKDLQLSANHVYSYFADERR
jgi:hypothetical protein